MSGMRLNRISQRTSCLKEALLDASSFSWRNGHKIEIKDDDGQIRRVSFLSITNQANELISQLRKVKPKDIFDETGESLDTYKNILTDLVCEIVYRIWSKEQMKHYPPQIR